jgi:hypothetical protein
MFSKKEILDKNKKETPEKFSPRLDECIYEYFIENYLTRWFHAKTIKPDVYNRASQELILLKKRKSKRDLKVKLSVLTALLSFNIFWSR